MLYVAFSLSGMEFEVGLQFEVGLLFWDAFGDGLEFDAAFFGFGGDLAFGVDFFEGLGGDLDFGVDFVFVGDFFGVVVDVVRLCVYWRAYPLFSSRLLSSSSNDEMFSYSDPSSEHEVGEDESLKYISCLGDGVQSTSFFLEARRAERRVGGVFIDDILFVKIAGMYIIKFRFITYGNTKVIECVLMQKISEQKCLRPRFSRTCSCTWYPLLSFLLQLQYLDSSDSPMLILYIIYMM